MSTLNPAPAALRVTSPGPPGFWWRVLMPFVAVIIGLIALVVALIVALLFVSQEMADAIATAVGSGVILGAGLVFVRHLPVHEQRAIFARKGRLGAALATGVAGGLGFVVLTVIVIAIGTAVDSGVRERTSDIPSPFGASIVASLLVVLGIVVLAPLGEELLFRGLMLRGLVRRMPFWPAASCSGIAFAVCHSDVWAYLFWPRMIALAVVGVGLAELNRRRGYWCGVVAHATINGLATIALLTVG
jgi:membrane protease YdiL (CAAX protease family)